MIEKFGTFVVQKHVVREDEGEETTRHTYALREKLTKKELDDGKAPISMNVSADEAIDVLLLDSEIEFRTMQPQKKLGES